MHIYPSIEDIDNDLRGRFKIGLAARVLASHTYDNDNDNEIFFIAMK